MIRDVDDRRPSLGEAWSPLGMPPWIVPLVVAIIGVAGTIGIATEGEPSYREIDVFAFVLVLAAPAALLVRRRWPVPVLLAVKAITLTYLTVGYPPGPIFLSLVAAFASAILAGARQWSWATLVIGWVLFCWLPPLVGTRDAPTLAHALGLAAWLLVLGAGCELIRARRERLIDAKRARTEEQRRQSADERLRMAQELHDVLAHHLSLINVQAGVALHLLDEQPDRPEQTRRSLAAIKEASHGALDELRGVLRIMRDGSAPREPTHSLADVAALVERSREAGLRVDLQVEGEGENLPGEVDRAAYRIVQESLTNAARYADGAPVTVLVRIGNEDLVVQVDDSGPGPRAKALSGAGGAESVGGTGAGIPGMRERARSLGGHVDAGARPGGGFRVRAWFPLRPAS